MTIRWKIALVEDDRRLARAVSAGLGEEGYTVRAVDTAGRGLELVRQWNPDVVLLDLMLPGRSGLEVLRQLRGRGFTKPILILTARDAIEDRVSGLDAGADDYLVKPVHEPELVARLNAGRRILALEHSLRAANQQIVISRPLRQL